MPSGSSSTSSGIYASNEEDINEYDENNTKIENEYNKQITEEDLIIILLIISQLFYSVMEKRHGQN